MKRIMSERLRLQDCEGRIWQTAEGYQDTEPKAPGWLLMGCQDGKEMAFSDVVGMYGFDGPEGNYLRVVEGTYP